MIDDSQQEDYSTHIAQILRDFMRLKSRFITFFPEELTRLKNRLDEVPLKGKAHRSVNYELFYSASDILYRKSNLTMGELSSTLSVPLSTATRLVDWLVDSGYATRLSDPEDRRIVRVALTDSGRQLHKTIESHVGQRFQQILSSLTAEEQITLFTLFRKMASSLKEIGQ